MVERLLKSHPRLFALASKTYYKLNRGFVTLSPGSPEAIHEAFAKSQRELVGEAGDYYEFGLFRGYTFWSAQDACNKLGLTEPRFYGFDSFEGLPMVEGVDRTDNLFFKGQFSCGEKQVEAFLTQQGVDWNRTTLVKGFYSDSLSTETKQRYTLRPVGVAFIDCDLYSSTCEVLEWLADLLVEGSILMFDDWYSFGSDPEVGQPKAFGEFLKSRPDLRAEPYIEFSDHGKAFVVHRET